MQKSDLSEIPKKGFDVAFWTTKAAPQVVKKNSGVLNAFRTASSMKIGRNGLPDMKLIESIGIDIKNVAAAYVYLIKAFEVARKSCMPKVHDDTKAAIDVYLKQAKIGELIVKAKLAAAKSMPADIGEVMLTHNPSSVLNAVKLVHSNLSTLVKAEPRVKAVVDGAARAAGAGAVARGVKKVGRALVNTTGTVEKATKMLDDHKAAIAKQAEDLARYTKSAEEMPKPETLDKKDRRHAGYTKSYGEMMKAIEVAEEVIKRIKLAAAAMGEPLRQH